VAESSVWGTGGGNNNADNADPVTLGTKVRTHASTPLWAVGIKYYRGTASAGTKTGRIFRTSDQVVISEVVTFTDVGTGWQEARFVTPVALATNTLYTAAVLFPSGAASFTSNYFIPGGPGASGITSADGLLFAPPSGDVAGNGVFNGGGTLTCPTSSFNGGCYWVDPITTDVNPESGSITLNGIASTLTIGQPALTAGAVTVSANGIASTATVGAPSLSPGAATIDLAGIPAASSVGQPALQAGPVTVALDGIASTVQVGSPSLTPGAATITLTGVESAVTIGQPALTPGPAAITLQGIASTLTIGQPRLSDPDVSTAARRFHASPPYTRGRAYPPRT
jgi:hypothetical protein